MINLKKLEARKEQVINLKKKLGLEGQKAEVVLALDFSGSMQNLFGQGSVQDLLERVLPLGLQFDDNGQVDFYGFTNSVRKFNDITLETIDGLAADSWNKFGGGGTSYAPVINQIVKDKTKSGGLKSLFGSKKSKLDYPVYVIYVTDGYNDDQEATRKAMIEASNHGIFFQFIGIGSSRFPQLETLDNMSGRVLDNANFFTIRDLTTITDEALYDLLLTEFPSWLPQAKALGQF